MNLKTLVKANADRSVALVLVVAGALALLLGWIGVSGVALAPEQIPYLISGGLGGIFLAALGATLWISADLQDEWRRLDVLQETLEELLHQQGAQQTVTLSEEIPAAASVATPPGTRSRVRGVSKTLA